MIRAFVPNSLPFSYVFVVHFIPCQLLYSNPMELIFATQDVPNLKFPSDESSLLVGVPISEGVASLRKASNQKLEGCFFHREPLSNLKGFASQVEVCPQIQSLLLSRWKVFRLRVSRLGRWQRFNRCWRV